MLAILFHPQLMGITEHMNYWTHSLIEALKAGHSVIYVIKFQVEVATSSKLSNSSLEDVDAILKMPV